jgi:hypothetical protein
MDIPVQKLGGLGTVGPTRLAGRNSVVPLLMINDVRNTKDCDLTHQEFLKMTHIVVPAAYKLLNFNE